MRASARLAPSEIVAPLDAGGMAEVYRARDTRLGRDVAIKVLPAEFAVDPTFAPLEGNPRFEELVKPNRQHSRFPSRAAVGRTRNEERCLPAGGPRGSSHVPGQEAAAAIGEAAGP